MAAKRKVCYTAPAECIFYTDGICMFYDKPCTEAGKEVPVDDGIKVSAASIIIAARDAAEPAQNKAGGKGVKYRGYKIIKAAHPAPFEPKRETYDVMLGDEIKLANIATVDTAKYVIDLKIDHGHWPDMSKQ